MRVARCYFKNLLARGLMKNIESNIFKTYYVQVKTTVDLARQNKRVPGRRTPKSK